MIAMILLLQGMQTYIMAQPQMVIMGEIVWKLIAAKMFPNISYC